MAGWYEISARATGVQIAIYDEIGAFGVSAKGFLAELGAAPEGAPIDLRLNSPGGSVFDAVAIHNALRRHPGAVTVWIDGIAASAASYVAMAGDEIVMPENAFLMIHDPAGLVAGTAGDMRAMAEALDRIKTTLARGYAGRTGRPEDEIAALMSAETWFDAGEALAAGLATRLADPVRMAARFDIARFRNAPPELVEAVTAPEAEEPPAAQADQESLANDKAFDLAQDNAELPQDASAQGDDTSSPSPDPDPAPDTGPDTGAIRALGVAHARAVIDLCQLAGQPQMAGRFLEEDVSLEAVRARLLALKAEASPEITAHHPQPGPSPSARPWSEILASTFKLKG